MTFGNFYLNLDFLLINFAECKQSWEMHFLKNLPISNFSLLLKDFKVRFNLVSFTFWICCFILSYQALSINSSHYYFEFLQWFHPWYLAKNAGMSNFKFKGNVFWWIALKSKVIFKIMCMIIIYARFSSNLYINFSNKC